ncbi:hypothetical protein C7B62_19815 [Pleurocapsa sp. CCALA 161]|nr:hypothetical protein C7B62_19815 [Pleurocapsa sp. CCALA 161]
MQRVVPKGIPQAYGGFPHCSDTALRRSAKSLRDVGANAPFKKRSRPKGYPKGFALFKHIDNN